MMFLLPFSHTAFIAKASSTVQGRRKRGRAKRVKGTKVGGAGKGGNHNRGKEVKAFIDMVRELEGGG